MGKLKHIIGVNGKKDHCPCCKKIVDEEMLKKIGSRNYTKDWGEHYKFLCKKCELLAFNVDYEENIKKETRYI